MTPETQVIRALNACRSLHKPTYVGLRALLDSDSDSERLAWLSQVAMRRVHARSEWRYFSYRTLKEIETDGTPTYRECIVGSPTTLLAEAYVLSLMAREKAFATPENVYSYKWPHSDRSGRNFQYYQYGYTRRNERITEQLRENPGHVAVVADIRRFYPSVKWTLLEPKIENRLASVQSTSDRRAIDNFLRGLRPDSGVGIPIGTDVSHVLGNLALEDVDDRLVTKFGERYFRYVDDIIVVCPSEDRDRVVQELRSCVESVDLKMHEGKDDVVAANTWVSDCPVISRKPVSGSFERLLHDICVYVLLWPKHLEPLQQAFASEGFTLPFGRLVTQVKYRPYRRFARNLLRRSGWSDAMRLVFTRMTGLIEEARSVRESLWSSLRKLASSNKPSEGMRRRWFVQQCRYNINRLLYLSSKNDYPTLLKLIPDGKEFAEYRILLGTFISGNMADILRLPGHVLATFCELAAEQEAPVMPKTFPDLHDRGVAESVTMLALYFGWRVPDIQTSQMYRGSKILLEVCSGGISVDNHPEEMSYLDEIELLFRGLPQSHLAELARTRFAEGEEIGLEGLWLGGGYGVS